MGQHFALQVEDLDATVAELRGRDVEVSDPGRGIERQSFLADPAGNLVELHEVTGGRRPLIPSRRIVIRGRMVGPIHGAVQGWCPWRPISVSRPKNAPASWQRSGGELGKAGINIDGFCAVVAGGRGVLHLLVEDADGARRALEGAGYAVDEAREALVVSGVEDRAGYLGETGRLAGASVNIEVAYLGTGTRLVLVVDDRDAAQRAL